MRYILIYSNIIIKNSRGKEMSRNKITIFSEEELSEILEMKMTESLFLFENRIAQQEFCKENLEEEIIKILNKVLESQKMTELSVNEDGLFGKINKNNLELNLPYEGKRELFKARASQQKFNAPDVIMADKHIVYIIKDYRSKDTRAMKINFINAVKMRIVFTNKDIREFNKKLELELKTKAEIIKQEIMKKIGTLENSGIKIIK